MSNNTEVLFNNHASLLIKKNGKFLLTDPWYQTPAFGSWLPTYPPYLHPVYLASLKDALTILVSHGHDDHFDDQYISLFDENTTFVTAKYKAPSVVNRLKRLGFENIVEVEENGASVNSEFFVKSFIVEELSHDDAVYTIATDDGVVIHANDNWYEFDALHLEIIKRDCEQHDSSSVLLFSQTNSASGFPLNYDNFNKIEKKEILDKKISGMVLGGLKNAESLSLKKMFSYAGFASVFVKNQTYNENSLFPTGRFLRNFMSKNLEEEQASVLDQIEIEDLFPGDVIKLPDGNIERAFVGGLEYSDLSIKEMSDKFYAIYGIIDTCSSYKQGDDTLNISQLEFFLDAFNNFATKRVATVDPHFEGILGKVFEVKVLTKNGEQRRSIKFGEGLFNNVNQPSKRCVVEGHVLQEVLCGDALFENLYTGYGAVWERYPKDLYNRDIVMLLVAFSYVYKNRICKQFSLRN